MGERSAVMAAPVVEPLRWLGAPSPFGLALPEARPSRSTMYGPRGVWLDDDLLVVADTGNHRVLVWHGHPGDDHAPADVVVGHDAPDRDDASLLRVPTGVWVHDGALVVADAWHHRVLLWRRVPERDGTPPDVVLGQSDVHGTDPDAGTGRPGPASFNWPYGVTVVAGRTYVADTGNRRVLGWDGLPEPGQPADLVLGQHDAAGRGENRDGPVAADSFRWPHAVTGDDATLLVADAGNHRVLGWTPPPVRDRPAELVLGQRSFTTAHEWPYGPQGPGALRFPYGITSDGGRLAVADTSNNRVLLWSATPRAGTAPPASYVLGQADFDANGENRWRSVERDTLCWPYGVHLHGDRLAVADSGNNRVMLWRVPPAPVGPAGNGPLEER